MSFFRSFIFRRAFNFSPGVSHLARGYDIRQALRLSPGVSPLIRGFHHSPSTNFRVHLSPLMQMVSHNSYNKELAIKLAEELKYEKENESDSSEPSFIKDFLSENPFKIEDKLGSNEVALTRAFGNEKIRLLFDINTSEQQAEPISLSGDEEEDDNEIDDASQEEDEDEIDDESAEQSLPIRCSITIEKPGKGALGFESIIADGVFLINYVSYYQDAKLAGDWTAEADWKRRGFYPGPSFETLDNDVQVLFEKYLEERGINTAVALFISNYAEYKEQKEYMKWLENVRKFVDVS